MRTKRYHPAIRQRLILQAALVSASQPGGWSKLTRQAIAKEADCSEALVSRYLGDMRSARKTIMRTAIRRELMEIIVQSIAAHDGYAFPKSLRTKAINSLLD